MYLETNMGYKLKQTDRESTNMERNGSKETDNVTETSSNTTRQSNGALNNHISPDSILQLPATPQRHDGLPHSATNPEFHGTRPHSAHIHHRQIGRILRVMGDAYCYSCGIALRQMGDQLAGEYAVRRAASTGDLPNSVNES